MMRQHTRLFGWSLAVLAIALFCTLGAWQLQRKASKEVLLGQASAALAAAPLPLAEALEGPVALHQVRGQGRFLARQVLLDNQLREGRAGIRVYQPFLADGSQRWVLVDLGWVPMPGDRHLPGLAPVADEHELQGLLAPAPAAGVAMGEAMQAVSADTWLAVRLDTQRIARELQLPGPVSTQVLRLDPAIPLGHARDLQMLPNTLPPSRHLGYAVQWFGLALAVLVIALLLEWRQRRRRR